MIFHEAPHKLKTTLADLREAFGDGRRISLCRELTKLNEETLRLTLAEAVAYYEETAPRGEYVLVVEGAPETAAAAEAFWTEMSIPDHVAHYVEQGMTKKDAIKAAAKDRGVPKNEVYQAVID
jgi:16S rRNA (cytidine1402-2'-O)-methyltransferase